VPVHLPNDLEEWYTLLEHTVNWARPGLHGNLAKSYYRSQDGNPESEGSFLYFLFPFFFAEVWHVFISILAAGFRLRRGLDKYCTGRKSHATITSQEDGRCQTGQSASDGMFLEFCAPLSLVGQSNDSFRRIMDAVCYTPHQTRMYSPVKPKDHKHHMESLLEYKGMEGQATRREKHLEETIESSIGLNTELFKTTV